MTVPRTRQSLVSRPRLGDRLAQSEQTRLTLVSGPAGFGKTTLVAGWLSDTSKPGRAVAWISVDSSDDDPDRFWRYVISALDAAVPDQLRNSLELSAPAPMSPKH